MKIIDERELKKQIVFGELKDGDTFIMGDDKAGYIYIKTDKEFAVDIEHGHITHGFEYSTPVCKVEGYFTIKEFKEYREE